MAVEAVMPKFGLTMTEGTIQKWFKSEGETVNAGEALFEVETEKVLYEVEAPAAGTIAKLLYPVEAVVAVGLPIAVIAEAGEDLAEVAAKYAAAAASPPVTPPSGASATTSPSAASTPTTRKRSRAPSTPAARKLATEHGIDIAQLEGSGPGGRITREDVQRAIDSGPRAPASDATAPVEPRQSFALRGIRKVIAERMYQSLQGSAQLTLTTEVDVTELIARRDAVQREFNATYNDFIVQACAHALTLHPRMNATLENDTIHQLGQVHVGLAVALDDGLIVPVVRNADTKPLQQIAEESRRLAERARAGKLTLEEVSNGTFTVSNLGTYGVDSFTPIINSPQTGILGVGRIVEKPVVHRGEIAKRSMMVLSLTFDHRVIDGAPAGDFLRTVSDLLAHGNRVALPVHRTGE